MSKEKPNGKTETQDPVRSSALMLDDLFLLTRNSPDPVRCKLKCDLRIRRTI